MFLPNKIAAFARLHPPSLAALDARAQSSSCGQCVSPPSQRVANVSNWSGFGPQLNTQTQSYHRLMIRCSTLAQRSAGAVRCWIMPMSAYHQMADSFIEIWTRHRFLRGVESVHAGLDKLKSRQQRLARNEGAALGAALASGSQASMGPASRFD
jgi:hypothetical protein